ncbi:hypothetical protein ZIOFF_047864 [Zingiber officinale]|uniref:CNNM transmembrane domain-containing protein n=1 Tax=Zingiber officinale TaxID=94328 RepID=A0A8J5FS85_ZINOF|nr:hypothetical protein ZIOFF_047864 [Zingiber officinale]
MLSSNSPPLLRHLASSRSTIPSYWFQCTSSSSSSHRSLASGERARSAQIVIGAGGRGGGKMAGGDDHSCCGAKFWVYLIASAGLVMFAGLMSGLTLGLMSLSLVDLEVLVKAGQPKDRRNAGRFPIPLFLLLILSRFRFSCCALPIFLDALVPAWGAILISVTLILAFGEIIPQAVCSRYGLSVGAKTAGLVRVLLLIFFPVAYPISKLLDWILGKGHFALMRRAELKTLVDMHGNEFSRWICKGGELTHDETTIITGALELTQKTAKDAMTPISDTFSLDINYKLDMHTLGLIMTKGHSRVPIYSGSPTNIIGLILVKNLITCRPEDEVPIRNVTIRWIPSPRLLKMAASSARRCAI